MSDKTHISLEERESFIKKHPFFCLLNNQDAQQLAKLMLEEYKDPNDVIVKEGDLIDKIFFIAEGQAEVSRDISTIDKNDRMHTAYLNKGDVIGLALTGLFSTTGIRTAEVRAITAVNLLSIELSKLHSLLSNYPAMKEIAEKFLLMNHAREIASLSHLNNDEIRHLIKDIKKTQLVANTKIFTQNEPANNCYVLITGTVNLTSNDQIQKIIKPDMLFGEEALGANNVYATTAIAQADCDLFRLPRSVIFPIKKTRRASLIERLKKIFSKG